MCRKQSFTKLICQSYVTLKCCSICYLDFGCYGWCNERSYAMHRADIHRLSLDRTWCMRTEATLRHRKGLVRSQPTPTYPELIQFPLAVELKSMESRWECPWSLCYHSCIYCIGYDYRVDQSHHPLETLPTSQSEGPPPKQVKGN